MPNIVSAITALATEEIERRLASAAPAVEERFNQEMKDAINSKVYSLGISGLLPRTMAYLESWPAHCTVGGLSCTLEQKYEPTGSHLSVNETQDVTGGLDDIVLYGSGPAVISAANAGRDHLSQLQAEAPLIMREVLIENLS